MVGLIAAFSGCQPTHRNMEPIIVYTPPPYQIKELPSAFSPLTEEESRQDWAKELILGDAFAKELDLYRAITCYKRAIILIPSDSIERRLQLDYNIILSYYLGLKYQDAINTFEESELAYANPAFPAFNNLLIILQDCYQQTDQKDKADSLFEVIEKCSPETARDLTLFLHLKEGNIADAQEEICSHPLQENFQLSFDRYYAGAKSPSKARQLNAILPGAGYYYLGQKKSAVTSFVINALFTAAAYQFFHRGYFAAGLITTSLEAGWYLGGINGAGIEAEEYNTRLYEGVISEALVKCKMFPVLMFETAF
ncbi:MAG: tetratricopeptide repeat protein [Parachlamydiaceae bacterium]|nr:tetratricopeptide repeat protein [Parachlamydiaceae bacterium]